MFKSENFEHHYAGSKLMNNHLMLRGKRRDLIRFYFFPLLFKHDVLSFVLSYLMHDEFYFPLYGCFLRTVNTKKRSRKPKNMRKVKTKKLFFLVLHSCSTK